VQVAIDAAELAASLPHSWCDPARHHLPVLPALGVGGMIAQMSISDSIELVVRRV
jgi:hypothetical protein